MTKKPFSIRIEQVHQDRFKALSTVLQVDGAKLLKDMLTEAEKGLNEKQKTAYEALLNCWKDEE